MNMGAYICAICENMFCSHEVNCHEYGNNELICEGCQMKLEEEKESEMNIHKAIENLKAVLCDPEGNVCIVSSPKDRQIIQDALKAIEDYA